MLVFSAAFLWIILIAVNSIETFRSKTHSRLTLRLQFRQLQDERASWRERKVKSARGNENACGWEGERGLTAVKADYSAPVGSGILSLGPPQGSPLWEQRVYFFF